jgi:site-specific DNA-methyltransferase (adenine-specific)
MTEREEETDGLKSPRAGAGRTGGARNHHPTLKPIALCTWLATLIKPPTPDAVLLVPFAGAGSEMIGALLAGWPCVLGIEGTPEYVTIAEARIAAWAPIAERIS